MVVAAPRDENELQHLLHTAVDHIRNGRGPIALRYPRGAGIGVALESEPRLVPVGKGELLRDGRDLCLLALGSTVVPALDASELLARQGISCAVADARYVKPLDEPLILDLASRVGGIVTVEEHVASGGFGSAVLQLLAAHGHRLPVEVIAVPDEFVEHGKQSDLRATYELDGPGIARRALAAFPRLGAAAVG